MLDKQDFGKFYVSLPRGQQGSFIHCIISQLGGSYSRWRCKLSDWSKGILDRKAVPIYARRYIEQLMAEDQWGTYKYNVCTQA